MENITVERNIYFGASAVLEGEEEDSSSVGIEPATNAPTPITSTPIDQPDLPNVPNLADINTNNNDDDEPEQPKPPVLLH